MGEKTISAAQRAANFSMLTRQNMHMIPSQTVTQLGQTIQFVYPKARLLSKTFLKVKAKFNKALTDITPLKAYSLIRRLSLNLNNGFEPFTVSGRDIALMNMLRINPAVINTMESGMVKLSEDKTELTFMIELENTLNQRDCSALVLLQNEASQCVVSLDFTTNIAEVTSTGASLQSATVSVCDLTYSIPSNPDAHPDLSVIKLTRSRTETLPSAGEHIIKLEVGTIYRKLAFYVTDENGNGVDLINSNIELIFNTADIPISIDAEMLKFKNTSDFGFEFPKGYYVLDFSGYAGFSNFGGTRDMIDTEALTEFWARFSVSGKCKVTIIQENLSRLRLK